MSKNICNYSQPSFYKFSEDSINLSKEVLSLIENNFPGKYPIKGLDLFAGCGVVGLEIMRNINRDISFDFVELQKDYEGFFYKNAQNLLMAENCNKVRFLNMNYLDLRKNGDRYDLIVSNPPYFYPQKNRISCDYKKNLCRFFINNTFSDFLNFILESLSQKGIAVFLLREDEVKNELQNFLNCHGKILKIEKMKTISRVSIFVATFLHK